MENNLDHVFKVLLIGDAGVGKSSILLQFTDGYFNDNLQSTIGMLYYMQHWRIILLPPLIIFFLLTLNVAALFCRRGLQSEGNGRNWTRRPAKESEGDDLGYW